MSRIVTFLHRIWADVRCSHVPELHKVSLYESNEIYEDCHIGVVLLWVCRKCKLQKFFNPPLPQYHECAKEITNES